MFVDREEEGVGVRNLDYFCGRHKLMTFFKSFFAIEFDHFFVFLCLFTLCSLILFFIAFACQAKEITTILKKGEGEQI